MLHYFVAKINKKIVLALFFQICKESYTLGYLKLQTWWTNIDLGIMFSGQNTQRYGGLISGTYLFLHAGLCYQL